MQNTPMMRTNTKNNCIKTKGVNLWTNLSYVRYIHVIFLAGSQIYRESLGPLMEPFSVYLSLILSVLETLYSL